MLSLCEQVVRHVPAFLQTTSFDLQKEPTDSFLLFSFLTAPKDYSKNKTISILTFTSICCESTKNLAYLSPTLTFP